MSHNFAISLWKRHGSCAECPKRCGPRRCTLSKPHAQEAFKCLEAYAFGVGFYSSGEEDLMKRIGIATLFGLLAGCGCAGLTFSSGYLKSPSSLCYGFF